MGQESFKKAEIATRNRYQSVKYAEQYKREYHSGWSFKSLRSRLIAHREIEIIRSLLDRIIKPEHTVLDIPCGTGKLGKLLHSYPIKILAADVSEEMMTLAKDEYEPQKFKGFLLFNATDIPLASRSLDNVVCLRLFQRLPGKVRRQILREFRRIVRSNLIVSYSYSSTWQKVRQKLRFFYDFSNPVFFHVDIKDIIEEFEEAGFAVRKCKYVLAGLSSEVVFHVVV